MLNNKKLFLIVLIFTICLIPNIALADEEITVTIDGQILDLDVCPVIDNGRILVPVRAIFEGLGMTVNYDGLTNTITGSKGQKSIILQLENTLAYVNGTAVILDVPAKSINGRTLVPIRFVAENCGADVVWDNINKLVAITTKAVPEPPNDNSEDLAEDNDYEEYAGYLLSEYEYLKYSGNKIIVDNIYISKFEDNSICAFVYIDIDTFEDFEDMRDDNSDYILDEYGSMALELSDHYHQDAFVILIYSCYYEDEPKEFKENNLFEDPVTYDKDLELWDVWFPLLQTAAYLDDPEGVYYYWWGY